jgi:CheY-like chemotaxis protein
VEVVHEGGSAVPRLQRGAVPRFLLLDLRMPGLSGVDLLRWVRGREELRQLLVVVLTGSNNRRELDEALAAGADVLLLKPFRFEDLVRQFKELRAMLEERPGRGTTSDCGAGRLMAAA